MTRLHGFITTVAFLGLCAGDIHYSHADDSWTAAGEGQRGVCLSDQKGRGRDSTRTHGDAQAPPCPIVSDPVPVIRTPPVLVVPTLEPSSPTRHEMLEFLRQLHNKLLESQHYPLDARKLGLEGTATVAFNLMPDGNAQAIRVRKTSGHSLLDEAALGAVQRILPFKPPLKAGSDPLELTVPISFALR